MPKRSLLMVLWLLLSASCTSTTDSSGSFIQPKTGSNVSGNLLLSIQAQDADGLARVYVSFNGSPQYLELCQSVQQCGGSNLSRTLSNIDPAAYAVNPGTLNLQLWVTDSGGVNTNVASVSMNWQPLKVDNLTALRSASGDQISVSWNENPAVQRYNLYLASVP
jgi:hypothetical protein